MGFLIQLSCRQCTRRLKEIRGDSRHLTLACTCGARFAYSLNPSGRLSMTSSSSRLKPVLRG